MLRRKTARSLAVLLALALLSLCACGEGGSIRLVETTPEPTAPPPTLEPLPERPEDLSVRVYCDGLLTDRGYYRNETVYLDPALLSGELGLPLENSADEDRFRVIIGDLTVTGDAGTGYFLAGERYLFAPHGWLTVDGRAFLPADALSKLFGVEIVCAEDPLRAEFSTVGAALMNGSGLYYLDWVKSESFPDTIQEVVFQNNGSAAFSPVESGEIHMVSDELSLIAAYLVLEGYNNVGESLYFVNPVVGNASWVTANRTFVVRIGDHDFYA